MARVKQVLLKLPWELDERIARLAKEKNQYKRPYIIDLIQKQVELEEEHRSPSSARIEGTGNDHGSEQ